MPHTVTCPITPDLISHLTFMALSSFQRFPSIWAYCDMLACVKIGTITKNRLYQYFLFMLYIFKKVKQISSCLYKCVKNDVVVKFTLQYGREVHSYMEKDGLAPKLFDLKNYILPALSGSLIILILMILHS